MGILRFLVWTTLCIGLGIFLGTHELGGRTAWQAMQGAWKEQSPRFDKVKEGAEDLAEDVRKKVATQDPAQQPKERHNKEDREAIDQIISKRSKL